MSDETETTTFGAAIAELEAILERVESEEIDIDALSSELGRAAELVALCREKLARAELEVSQIVEQLEEPEPAG